MKHELILAGFGGQGLLYAGKVIAVAAMNDNKNVTWMPSYGPEMRGGTANCHVIISDAPIGTPVVTHADSIIIFNAPSLDKFEGNLKEGGLCIAEKELINRELNRTDVEAVLMPAVVIAREIGAMSLANMVAAGQFIKKTNVVSLECLIDAMRKCTPPSKAELAELNEKMIRAGYEYGE